MWGVDVSLHAFLIPEQYGGEWTASYLKVIKVKDKVIPLHAWIGPEVSSRMRLPDFKTICT
jgi:hypothetical protein